jgi:hypothetical protein
VVVRDITAQKQAQARIVHGAHHLDATAQPHYWASTGQLADGGGRKNHCPAVH